MDISKLGDEYLAIGRIQIGEGQMTSFVGKNERISKKIKAIKLALAAVSTIRLIPHIALYMASRKRLLLDSDLQRWISAEGVCEAKSMLGRVINFVYIMTYFPEYRSVFYFRHRYFGHALGLLCRGTPTVAINAEKCGPGLYLQHGFGILISAESIGANLTAGQMCTVGYDSRGVDRPIIGDNVTIGAGARILGRVRIGDNVRVSANSLVISNVPANCVAMGVPAKIIWEKTGAVSGQRIASPPSESTPGAAS